MSRRKSISSASCAVRNEQRSARRGSFGIRHLPRADEPVLSKLRNQRVNHVRQPPASCHHSTLPLVGGTPFEYLAEHIQFVRAAQPLRNRLKLQVQLVQLIAQRRGRPRR